MRFFSLVVVVALDTVVGSNDSNNDNSFFSSFPPGDFCQAFSGCSSPAKYVAPLFIPSVIDGTNGGSATIESSKGCQQVFHNSNGNACGSATEVWGYDGTWPGPTGERKFQRNDVESDDVDRPH